MSGFTSSPPAGPWQIVVADGSGNRWTLDGVGPKARWTFAPVMAAESSTGFYSGGVPGAGELDPATTATVWSRVRALVGDRSVQVVDRAKGTVALHLEAAGQERDVVVAMGKADDLVAVLLKVKT